MIRRRPRRAPFAAFSAFVFLFLLFLAPIVGARLIADAYGARGADYRVTPLTIAMTADAIDEQLRELLTKTDDRRGQWSTLIREEVEAGRLSSARGLLLAGPVVLEPIDALSLEDFARSSTFAGDDAIEAAALRYVSEPAREAYERAQRMAQAEWLESLGDEPAVPESEPVDATLSEDAPTVAAEETVVYRPSRPETSNANTSLNVLGDSRDLALQASRWTRGERIDIFEFALSGLGISVLDDRSRSGASILRAAYRADRINPDLQSYFRDLVYAATPPQELRRQLENMVSGTLAIASLSDEMESLFISNADPQALRSLQSELWLVNDIAMETSVFNAITFLESARGYADLRRARLVAESGGDKAIALARLDPAGVLHTAQTEIPWTNEMRFMLASLFAMVFVLGWLCVQTLIASFRRRRPRRRSAVYALEEPEWLIMDHR